MCQFLLGTVQLKSKTSRILLTNVIVSIPFRYGTTIILQFSFRKYGLSVNSFQVRYNIKKMMEPYIKIILEGVNSFQVRYNNRFFLLLPIYYSIFFTNSTFFLKFHLFLILICILLAAYHSQSLIFTGFKGRRTFFNIVSNLHFRLKITNHYSATYI